MDKIFFKINYFSKILPIKSNYLEIIANCQCFPEGENVFSLYVVYGQWSSPDCQKNRIPQKNLRDSLFNIHDTRL